MDIYDFLKARDRISSHLITTPLIPLERLHAFLGFTPWVKLENLQNIGAFKIRGAMNAVLQLPEEKRRPLITASSGNHGRAVAYAAKALGLRALIVLPVTVSTLKRQEIEWLGAETLLVDPQSRITIAQEMAEKRGYTFIHPFDDDQVIAGQGSIGLEILEQFPAVKRVLVPMGGGGLISGIAMAIKFKHPEVEVIGLELAAVPKFSQNLQREIPEAVQAGASIGDALMSNKPGIKTLRYVKQYVDHIYSVDEEYLKEGYRLLVREGRIYCEPSAAIGFGAVLQGFFKKKAMENSVYVISGGNITPQDMAELLK